MIARMWRRIRRIELSDQQVTRIVILVLGGIFLVALAVLLIAYVKESPVDCWQWIGNLAQNVVTEMFGAIVTFLLIDRVLGGRQRKREAEEKHKQDRLNAIAHLRQANSTESHQAVLDDMEARHLLKGADLRGIILVEADLRGFNLVGANLSSANLSKATLVGANLSNANLSKATLFEANLSGADLNDANLIGANLSKANLSKADLIGADLEGAKNITCEQLRQAKTLERATLPDGTWLPGRSTWNVKSDLDWREAFKEWCETIPVDKHGYIIVSEEGD